jgi:hypothetical protein
MRDASKWCFFFRLVTTNTAGDNQCRLWIMVGRLFSWSQVVTWLGQDIQIVPDQATKLLMLVTGFFPSRSMFQINEDRIGDNKNASLPLSLTRMVKMVVCELEGEGWELIWPNCFYLSHSLLLIRKQNSFVLNQNEFFKLLSPPSHL